MMKKRTRRVIESRTLGVDRRRRRLRMRKMKRTRNNKERRGGIESRIIGVDGGRLSMSSVLPAADTCQVHYENPDDEQPPRSFRVFLCHNKYT